MIPLNDLKVLNKMKCKIHNKTPNAKYDNHDLSFTSCCDDFDKKIRLFVKDINLKLIQDITRKKFGL